MIRTALAGYGWWGRHMARRLVASPSFDFAGVTAPELTSAQTDDGHPVLPSLEAVLNDPDIEAVILTTPNLMHYTQVMAAADTGKHVFCEKPLAMSGAEAREMVDTCRAAGVVLGIGHERRFEPAMQALRKRVSTGALGTVLHVEAAFSHDKLTGIPAGNWRTQPETAPAAGMTGMGIHLTDFLIWMFGKVDTVQALTSRRVLDWETGDTLTVQLGFRSGVTASLSALLATPHFIRFHVFGSKAWAEVRNDTHPDTPGGAAHLTVSRTGEPFKVESHPWTDAVSDNLAAFADAIEGHAPYPFTEDEMVHNIEVFEAVVEAAKTRETVRL